MTSLGILPEYLFGFWGILICVKLICGQAWSEPQQNLMAQTIVVEGPD